MARPGGPDNTDSDAAFDADLARFAAESRVDEAIRGRSRERSLRQQEREATSLRDLAVSLAEVGAAVTIAMDSGRTHRGRIASVGSDVLVCDDGARSNWLALSAVAAITATTAVAGARPTGAAPLDTRFLDALGALCGSGAAVVFVVASGLVVRGEALWLSEDAVAVRASEPPGVTTYLRLASVAEFSVTASG